MLIRILNRTVRLHCMELIKSIQGQVRPPEQIVQGCDPPLFVSQENTDCQAIEYDNCHGGGVGLRV